MTGPRQPAEPEQGQKTPLGSHEKCKLPSLITSRCNLEGLAGS